MRSILFHSRILWACVKKDFHISLTERIFLITLIMIPLQYLLLFIIFVMPSDHAPTAVVMLDHGTYAQQLFDSMGRANSFRAFQATPQDAANQMKAGKIVAIVTIPADFDTRVQHKQEVPVSVQINNLDTDFTDDLRRAVPLSITLFYAKAFPKLVSITPHETDWYKQDTGYIAYITVSVFVLALAIGGAIQSGTSWAREWELGTMKELLLSPAPRWALIVGKMIGSFLIALVAACIVLLVLVFALKSHPKHLGDMAVYTLLTLLIFSSLGTLIGTIARQRRLITTIVLGSSLFFFFISGPLGPPSFDTLTINFISRLTPLAYAIAGMQYAFHNFNTNTLGYWNAVVLAGFAACFTLLAVVVLRRSVVN